MSTNSRIGLYGEQGINSIYCHWDGYIEHNGVILNTYYDTEEEVRKLLALGDLSVLGKRLGEQVDFDKMASDALYRERYEGQCVAYHRDRGEEFLSHTFDSMEDMRDDQEYNYIFKDGRWFVSCERTGWTFQPLDDYTQGEVE